jgi:hypothetical protein
MHDAQLRRCVQKYRFIQRQFTAIVDKFPWLRATAMIGQRPVTGLKKAALLGEQRMRQIVIVPVAGAGRAALLRSIL